MKRFGKYFICLVTMVVLMLSLVACKDDSYADLHIPDNANTIKDLCRLDATFTSDEAKEFATLLAQQDFKKIKKTSSVEGGQVVKFLLTDTNDVTYVVIMQDNYVVGLQDSNGQSLYIRTIKQQ